MEKDSKSSTDLFSVSLPQKCPRNPAKQWQSENVGCVPWLTAGVRSAHVSWLPTHHVLGTSSNPRFLMICTRLCAALPGRVGKQRHRHEVTSINRITNQGQNRDLNLSYFLFSVLCSLHSSTNSPLGAILLLLRSKLLGLKNARPSLGPHGHTQPLIENPFPLFPLESELIQFSSSSGEPDTDFYLQPC